MERLNIEITKEQETKLLEKLLQYVDRDIENLSLYIDTNTITCNTVEGKDYFWFYEMENGDNAAIDMDGNIYDADECEKIFD